MKVWTVLVRTDDPGAWVDSVYESYSDAVRRAHHIEDSSAWLDTIVEPFIIIPERTKPLK